MLEFQSLSLILKSLIMTNVYCYIALSCQTINSGNINDIRNLIIIINGPQERIGSPNITTKSLVM